MKRRLAAVVVAIALVAAAYLFVLRDETVAPTLVPARATSAIGVGSSAVGVSADGAVLTWLPPPGEGTLPLLPLSEPPRSGHLAGTALAQARVLGALAQPSLRRLRPYVERSYYGESGVDIVLSSGIELRFGDASQATRKWKAAAAVLADPSVSTLDYVDLHAPSRPTTGGSGHTLPPPP